MRSGLYAIASFEERPIDRADAAQLGIREMPNAHFGCHRADTNVVPEPYERDGCITYWMGEMDDSADAAQRLNLPPQTSQPEIASHALDRWHDRIAVELPGHWSLLRWDQREHRIWIVTSHIMPDPILIARSGAKVAIAPDAPTLRKLPWVGREIDADGVARAALPWKLRRDHPNPCIFKNVSVLQSGALYSIDAEGVESSGRPQRALTPFHGSFEEGSAQLEQIARSATRKILERHDTVAVLLSGGLDSSLVALFAAQEARAGQRIIAVSSVAMPGSDAEDERYFIDVVAQSLGIEVIHVTPPDDLEFLCPHESVLDARINPSVPSNHHVYRHLLSAAHQAGATACIGGEFGEAHFSRLPFEQPPSLTRSVKEFVRGLRPRRVPEAPRLFWPSVSVEERAKELAYDPMAHTKAPHTALFGYGAAAEKSGRTAIRWQHESVSYYHIFEAPELIELAAGFPDHFSRRNERTRALARDVLMRHLPQEIWGRADKKPISPDFGFRMARASLGMRQSVERYASEGVDRWIDLDRIAAAIAGLSGNNSPASLPQLRRIQLSLCAAAFMSHWQTRI